MSFPWKIARLHKSNIRTGKQRVEDYSERTMDFNGFQKDFSLFLVFTRFKEEAIPSSLLHLQPFDTLKRTVLLVHTLCAKEVSL